VYWYGSEPRLCLTDAAQIKEFLSSKYAANATGKSWLQRQGTRHFIGRGVLMANGAHWSHQRHVVAPAFMPDKLKVPPPPFTFFLCPVSFSFFLFRSFIPSCFLFFSHGLDVLVADVTGRIAGTRGSHGGVHEADDPGASGCSVGAVVWRRAASRGGDLRVHDSAHGRHHLAHRVRHEL
jgi:hypothetical protein